MKAKISKSAMYQYLRYEKGMTYEAIAKLYGCTSRNIWNKCNGEWKIKKWEDRSKEEKVLCTKKYKEIIKK
ncbi:MAG: hypothetical protein M0P15_04345 [Bacteroides sp.]|nr:hypothetical protein [Bacteroides sp.]